jgi:hypothetical protein
VFDVSEILREGENDVVIIASTTLFNVMGPNRISGILDDEGIGPRTFIEHDRFTAKRELTPFGLGSAHLIKIL